MTDKETEPNPKWLIQEAGADERPPSVLCKSITWQHAERTHLSYSESGHWSVKVRINLQFGWKYGPTNGKTGSLEMEEVDIYS